MTTPLAVLRSILTWPSASQQHARRNALVASTRLTQARIERLAVEEFLAAEDRRRQSRAAARAL